MSLLMADGGLAMALLLMPWLLLLLALGMKLSPESYAGSAAYLAEGGA